ncbi:hypothetical protein C8R47DRAFT_1225144 [Mycena vitilis]|nr:hypothetical protein C8R47DRAFT_1225144 [Mycena vitilis]
MPPLALSETSPQPETAPAAVDDTMLPLEPVVPSRPSSPNAPVTAANNESAVAPDPPLPPVPAWHPWSSQEAWRRCWDRMNHFHAVFGERERDRRVPDLTPEWMTFPTASGSGLTYGEGVERMWAGGRPLGTCAIHVLRLISIYGVREVKCNCTDGQHTAYEHEHAFAFRGRDGDLIIKKETTRLLVVD